MATAVSAAVSAVVGAGHAVVNTVSQLYERFTASNNYEDEALILNGKLEDYKQDVRIRLLRDSGTTKLTLKRAESTLKRAEARFNRVEERVDGNQCRSHIWWLYARVALTLSPVDSELKMVKQDLENIHKLLQEEEEFDDRRREADISTIVHDNDKYVPIQKSQSQVIKAIEDLEGPPMILLHGGVGKGKSTLARYMCKRYGSSGEKSNLFDHVIVVSCGNSSIHDPSTKQYEILDNLSATSLTEESDSKSGMGKSGKKVDSKSRIAEALRKYLLGKKILMLLDDVSDPGFLYEMWMAARDGIDDKILITSQRSNLCDDFKDDSVLIAMESPDNEEARKILASLVGLENKTIPRHLQGIANKMIEAIDRNPLALACLASTFSYSRNKEDKKGWQVAWNELSTQLANKEKIFVIGQNDGTVPSRSLCGAMELCINSLENKDAKRTLFLTYACKGESVPEAVLRILCAGIEMSNSMFNRSRDELLMRELLKCRADTVASKMDLGMERNDEELQESPAWSLQSLVKLYMKGHVAGKQEMRAEMRAVMGSLLRDDDFLTESSIKCKEDYETEIVETGTKVEENDEMRVRIALCALYFDRQHTDQVVTRAVTKACKKSNLQDSDDNLNDLRRKAIEPLVWLLDKCEEGNEEEEVGEEEDVESGEEPGEVWTEMDKCRVRKVLLEYICKRQLDTENISYLLKLAACPSAQLATLKAITHISSIEETPLLNETTISFLQAVVDLVNLKDSFHTNMQVAASTALSEVCWKAARDKTATLVASMSGVLDVLVHSLAIPTLKSDAVAENAASALTGLAFLEDVGIERVIVNKPGVLASLVICLDQQSKPGLQIAAARALRNLAGTEDDSVKLRISNEEGALVGLVKCLSTEDHPDLQKQSAWVLANLASSEDDALKLRVANEEGALVGLVKCLSTEDHPDLQTEAAGVLANLTNSEYDALKLRIANLEGVLVGLVKCLSTEDHPDLQTGVAWVLGNLTGSEDDALKLRVANEEGALVGLVKCLSNHDHPDLQTQAARVLSNLASSEDDALTLRVANEEGALVGLVNCLSIYDHPDLQTQMATAFSSLTGSEDDAMKLRIANLEGVLVSLVKCLSTEDHPDLQKQSARVLANLACLEDDALKLRVANEEGALVGLVKCLSNHDHPDLQTQAARVLSNLASSKDDALTLRVANEEGALVGLVNCLSIYDHPDLQTQAAMALSNLTSSEYDALRLRIANLQGVLVSLVKCLSTEGHPDLQTQAAKVLSNLASSEDDALTLRVANEEGALVGLVKCLSNHDHPDLQTQAAMALSNFASSEDGQTLLVQMMMH